MAAPLKILFLAADPSDRATRKFDREFHLIEQKIRLSAYRDAIELVKVGAVRPEDLSQHLLQHDPDIVHFTGHGETGGIVFEDAYGNSRLVQAEALAAVFEALAGKVRLVFLNAGYSARQAEAISAHVDFVVGMGFRIILEAASSLASTFYQVLGFGRSVQNAFDMAKAATMLDGIPDESIPRLLVRQGADAGRAMLGPASPSPSDAGSELTSAAARESRPAPETLPGTTGPGPLRLDPLAPPPVELPASLLRLLEPLRGKMHAGTNTVLPILGSSLGTAPDMPSWRDFIASLIDLATDDLAEELRELLAEQQYLDLVELLEAQLGPSRITSEIRRVYQRPAADPGEVYDRVATLPCTHFATTHYTPWLKQAVSRCHPAPRVYIPGDPGALTDLGPESPPLVLMLHGDADRPEHCVLSQRSLRKLMHSAPAYQRALSALATQRSFLFIGHTMRDPDIVSVLDEWVEVFGTRDAASRHYLLGAGLKKRDRIKLQRLGVQPIEYGKRDDASLLAAVLHYLARPPGSEPKDGRRDVFGAQSDRARPYGPSQRDAARFAAALPRYAAWARENFSHLSMAGLGASQLRLPLEHVFVPLRYVAPNQQERFIGSAGGGLHDQVDRHQEQDITLDRAFRYAAPAKHLFILGDPGSGKTTALKKLLWSTLVLSTDGDDHDGQRPAFDGTKVGLSPGIIPVFLPLRNLDASSLRRPLAEFLDRQLSRKGAAEMETGFGTWLWSRGDLLLQFDGLDEVADRGLRGEVCRYLEEQLQGDDASSIRAVVSCRFAGRVGLVGFDDSFAELEIRPLADDQVEALAARWFQTAGRAIAQSAGGDVESVERAARAGFAEGLALARTLESDTSRWMRDLVGTPLLLTLLCVVVRAGNQLPRQREVFFADCLRTLIERWRVGQRLQLPDALSLLQPLAARMHQEHAKELYLDELRDVWRPILDRLDKRRGQRISSGQVLDCLCRGSGVLAEFAHHEYGFMHLSLQEYLASKHLAIHGDVETLATHFGEPWWRDVGLCFVASGDHRLFTPLLRRLVAGDALLDWEDWLRELLAEAHVPEMDALVEVMLDEDESDSRLMAALRLAEPWADDAAREAAKGLAEKWPQGSGVYELAIRVAELDEPMASAREAGEPFEDRVTGIRFLWIPEGRFRMGFERAWPGWEDVDVASIPGQWVEVSGFWLAETPVTNREYEVFLEDSGHEVPGNWRDRRYNDPEQPVVGVTWQDARAFCDWLSQQSGMCVTLPREAQWEYAARGPASRLYPWGHEEPAKKRANFEYNHDQPSPVRSLPDGRGPFGTFDQAGNVWEWCQDEWDEGETARATARAVRGGSWAHDARNLRAGFRGASLADDANGYLGFRVVCLPASEGHSG